MKRGLDWWILLAVSLVAYMKHLKEDYPYLFSLAVRTNPFDPNASAEVKQKRVA